MLRLTASILALLFAGLTPVPGHAAKGEVTITLPEEPPTMDPHIVSNAIGSMVWRWSYDTLVSAETGTGKLVPWLAERWERLGLTQYKFWLRKGVRFADGTPVTAKAVQYSMGRIMDPKNKSTHRTYFKEFDRIEILDDHTFIWRTKTPDNGLINRLVRWGVVMSPQAAGKEKAEISRNTFGSGAYVLKSWTKGQRMVFEANPDWWLAKPYPDRPQRIVLRRIQEASTRLNAILAGEVDIMVGVLPQHVARLEQNPALRVASVPGVRIMWLAFHTRSGGPFADPKVRLAANHAIDAEHIRKTLLQGKAEPIGQMLHPWNFAGYQPGRKWYGYDLEKARTLMRESRHPGGFQAKLYTTAGRYPADRATCEAVVGMLKKIQIDTRCESLSFPLYRKIFSAYQSGKEKEPAMFYQGYGNAAGDPVIAIRATSSCMGAWSQHCFKDLDEALDKAAATVEPEAQHEALAKMTDMMMEKATHKIFFQIHDVSAHRRRVEFRPRHDETLFAWEIRVLD